jgi:hypothetical protein
MQDNEDKEVRIQYRERTKKKKIRVKARFSTFVQTSPGTHTASYTMGTGSFPEVKRPGRYVNHPLTPRRKKE